MKRALVFTALFLAMISNARAENLTGPAGNWNKVQNLPRSTNVVVLLKHAGEVDGEFIKLTEQSIVVKEFGREREYPKTEVAKVRWIKPGSRARNAAIIGGIGFGIGFGLGYAGGAKFTDRNEAPAGDRAVVGAAMGGFIGGVAAAISMAHRPGPRAETIYTAR